MLNATLKATFNVVRAHWARFAAGTVMLGALAAGGAEVYDRAFGDCCSAGAPCCYPGSPCCANHHHGAAKR